MRTILSLSLFIFLITSCKKENNVKVSYDILSSSYVTEITDSFPDWAFRIDTLFIRRYLNYNIENLPCFNPNNPSEFCYNHWDSLTGEWSIKTFNLETGVHNVIYTSPVGEAENINWGKSNKIAFSLSNSKKLNGPKPTFTINPDGTNINMIYSFANIGYPVWSDDGKYLYVCQYHENPTGNYYGPKNFVRMDGKSLEIIDTIYNDKIKSSSTTSDNSIFFIIHLDNDYQICKARLDQFSPEIIFKYNDLYNYFEARHLFTSSPDGNFLYFYPITSYPDKIGLYRLNTNTKEVSKYKSANRLFNYRSPSFSPDGRYMLCNKTYFEYYSIPGLNDLVDQVGKSYIHIIDLHTDKEYRVDLN